jgi:hypothetical protein
LSSILGLPVFEISANNLSKYLLVILLLVWSVRVADNGLGLCEEAELEAQMFSLAQMFIRMPNVQFSTEPAFLQNPCWWQYFIRVSFLRLGLQTLHQ